MSNNFFSDEEEVFQDIPEEVNGQDAPIPQVHSNRPSAPVQQPVQQAAPEPQYYYPEESEEVVEGDDEEDFSSVLTEARFKLELGSLYEMLMNHDIFAGTQADDKAIKYVTKKIRNFAKEQMEIMLGMRQEAVVQTQAAVDFPFNDLEVQTLKALARAATKGASAAPEAQTYTPQPVAPARVGLNTISRPAPRVVQAQPKPVARQAAPAPAKQAPQKPLPQKAAAPIKRDPRKEAEIDRILAEEGITREEYDRQYDPNYKPLEKNPFGGMTDQDLINRNKQAKTRRAVNPNAIPMPSPEQEELLHTQRAHAASVNPQMQSIMSLLTKKQ